MRKKLLSIFLVLVMVLCLAPMTVFAENTPTSVATEAALREALGNGESVKLAANITLTSDLDITKKVSIDLNGYTIDGEPIYKNESYTVFELTISDSKGGGQIVCPLYNTGFGDLIIENGIFSEQITGGKYGESTNFKISNGTFNKGVVANGEGYIFDGTFKGDDTITLRDGSEITNYAVTILGVGAGIKGGNFDCNVKIRGFDTGGSTLPGGIHGGTFNKIVDIIQQGCIYDGNFLGKVIFESIGTISGGTFSNAVTNTGTITGGTFSGDVIAASGPVILPGSTVENQSIIFGGDFSGTVTNDSKGTISGGTFKNKVINNGTITGGTFKGTVTNNGTIKGGTFYGGITGTGTIDGLTVTYKNGSEDYAVQVVQNGDSASEPISPKQKGYTFSGWYTDPECSKAFDFETMPVTADMTLYAKWIERSDYTVEYDTAGGSTIENKTDVNWTAKVTEIITPPTRDGYKLTGWKCGDVEVDENTTYADLAVEDTVMSVTLTAQWKENAVPVTPDTGNDESPAGNVTDENFVVNETAVEVKSPKTGDSSMFLWMPFLIVSGSVATIAILALEKRKYFR